MVEWAEHMQVLEKSPLFAGIAQGDMRSLLGCLTASRRRFEKNEFIFREGQPAESIGIVLTGRVHVLEEDFWGNRVILGSFGPGALFGEAFSCAQADRLPVSVMAAARAEILLVDYRRVITTCSSSCPFHAALIGNMLRILAEKNILLTRKIGHVTKRTTREKLLSFLSEQAARAGGNRFEIPFNRQELAEYLSVDRSAMSSELGKMRDEGILRFDRNRFEILVEPATYL